MMKPALFALGAALLADGRNPADDSVELVQVSHKATVGAHMIQDIEGEFRSFDTDTSGSLNLRELTAFLGSRLGSDVSPAQARKIMRKSDRNVDWEINLDEFLGCAADPNACGSVAPTGTKEAGDGSAAATADGKQGSSANTATDSPDGGAHSLQVEKCSKADRSVLFKWGMDLETQGKPRMLFMATPPKNLLNRQSIKVGGVWVETHIMPKGCKSALQHVSGVDEDAHAQCLQEQLGITMSCGQCHAKHLARMVEHCTTACMVGLSSQPCLQCTRPLELLECVAGEGRLQEMSLTEAQNAMKEDGGGDLVVVAADTTTGELIWKPRHIEEHGPIEWNATADAASSMASHHKEKMARAVASSKDSTDFDPLAAVDFHEDLDNQEDPLADDDA